MARLHEDLVAEVVLEETAQDVHGQVGTRVAHVAGVVHGRAASIPAHLVAFFGHEELLLARERVVHAQPRHTLPLRRRGWMPPWVLPAAHLVRVTARARAGVRVRVRVGAGAGVGVGVGVRARVRDRARLRGRGRATGRARVRG